MSFAEVLEELPALTLEFDEPSLSAADASLINERLAAHRANPSSSVPLDEMKSRLVCAALDTSAKHA